MLDESGSFYDTGRMPEMLGRAKLEELEVEGKKMLNGNADNMEKSILTRMGPLGRRVSKGTWWGFRMIEGAPQNKPAPPPAAGAAGAEAATATSLLMSMRQPVSLAARRAF